MNELESRYYAQVKKLGLSTTTVPTVFLGSDGTIYRVPLPEGKTAEQLDEIIEKIKERLGIEPRHD